LEGTGIEVLDYSDLIDMSAGSPYLIEYENLHPTPEALRMVAERLAQDVKGGASPAQAPANLTH
jgi:hypothetical protein